MNSFRLNRILTVSLLIAIEVLLSRFLSISTPLVKFSIGFVPIVLIAFLYGPLYSSLAWGLADFLGANLFPIGAYFFGFSLTAFLAGLVLGFFLYQKNITFLRASIASLIVCFPIQFFLDTVWLTLILGKGFVALAPLRLVKAFVIMPIMIAAILFISKTFSNILYQRSTLYFEKSVVRKKAKLYLSGEFLKNRKTISDKICEKIINSKQYQSANAIFCYYPKEYEIDVLPIITDALKLGKTICVPLCIKNREMLAKKISSLEDFSKGKYGIMEPLESADTVDLSTVELAIVPSLCCDTKKQRMGHGFGYYDKALKHKSIYKIAVCPSNLLFEKLPSNSFDVKMNSIYTEHQDLIFG